MDRRRKILVAALLLILIGYFAELGYRRLYEQPLASACQELAVLDKELRAGQLTARRQQNRLPLLDELKERSLPRNLEIAVSEYRSWLLQTLTEGGLQQASLDSSTPARFRQLYDRIDFTLRTRGTLSQIAHFMYRFYDTRYLHKIRSLSLTPAADGSLDISLTIETLSIPAVAHADRLSTSPSNDQSLASFEQYDVISRRNLFRPGDPPASQIKLSAITSDAGKKRHAWLSFAKTGETRILSAGDAFVLDGSHLRIQEVTAETVQVLIDGHSRKVPIGSTLE